MQDVDRLERIRDVLAEQGHHSSDATLALYSLHGYAADVRQAAAQRTDLLLVDIDALYGDGPVRGGA
jgi:uncharacterized protein